MLTSEMTAEDTRLGELYVRHASDAVRLAYLLTGDRALAEDLVQDAFVKLAGRLVHLRDPGAFEAYLQRTVVNLSRSHFRRRKVERAYVDREARKGALKWNGMGGRSVRRPRPRPIARSASETNCGGRCEVSPSGSGSRSSCATTKICPNSASPNCCDVAPER